MANRVPQIVSLSVKEVAPPAPMGHHLDGDTNVCAGVLWIDLSNCSGLRLTWIIFSVNPGRFAERDGNYHYGISV